jgi:predicted nucleic acid-binding protein
MNKMRFMLDSNVVIEHLNKQLDIYVFLDRFPLCEVYINLVVEIESLAKPDMDKTAEAEARVILNRFKWAEIDKKTREIAVQIRRRKTLLLPDALIAASAITLNAAVLSNDPHLRDFQMAGYKALPCI